jgi:hypothetical protein
MEQDHPLAHEPFSYRELKDDRVQLLYEGRVVETLAGAVGRKFLARIEGASAEEAQLLMARATKNFKRGNERLAKNKRRRP